MGLTRRWRGLPYGYRAASTSCRGERVKPWRVHARLVDACKNRGGGVTQGGICTSSMTVKTISSYRWMGGIEGAAAPGGAHLLEGGYESVGEGVHGATASHRGNGSTPGGVAQSRRVTTRYFWPRLKIRLRDS